MKAKPIYVDFSKGLNTQDNPLRLQDGECQIAQDCNFDQVGSVLSRKFNVTYLEFNSKPRTIFPYSNLLTHLENGNLYDLAKLMGSGYGKNRFSSLEYNNIWYATNIDNQIRYDGTNIHSIGNIAPAAAPTVADEGTAGNPDGTYYYKYTYLDDNGKESDASDASVAVTVTTNKINVTVVASAVGKVDSINIYRLGGTLTDWYFVANTTNTNHTYTDNIADSSLSTLYDADNNNPPPTSLKFMVEHYQRLIGGYSSTYPNGIFYTLEYEPEYWGSSTNQQYYLGNDKTCTGLIAWGRIVLFFKISEIYAMEGSDPDQWHRRRASQKIGNVSPYALSFYTMPIFCDYKGLFQFDGYNEKDISRKIRNFFTNNIAYLTDAVGEVYNKKYYFGLENQTLVYDFEFDRFLTYNFGLSAICSDEVNDILYSGINNNVVKMEQDLNDSEETINFQIKSKKYILGDYFGKSAELTDYIILIDTKGEDVTFNIYIDDKLKQEVIINTKSLQIWDKNFNANLKGYCVEFEFIYNGTKQIQIDLPITINPERNE